MAEHKAIVFKIPKKMLFNKTKLIENVILLKANRYIPKEYLSCTEIRFFEEDGYNIVNNLVTIRLSWQVP